jgi:hypothetical protein
MYAVASVLSQLFSALPNLSIRSYSFSEQYSENILKKFVRLFPRSPALCAVSSAGAQDLAVRNAHYLQHRSKKSRITGQILTPVPFSDSF